MANFITELIPALYQQVAKWEQEHADEFGEIAVMHITDPVTGNTYRIVVTRHMDKFSPIRENNVLTMTRC
jgi:hypothetical protein